MMCSNCGEKPRIFQTSDTHGLCAECAVVYALDELAEREDLPEFSYDRARNRIDGKEAQPNAWAAWELHAQTSGAQPDADYAASGGSVIVRYRGQVLAELDPETALVIGWLSADLQLAGLAAALMHGGRDGSH